MEVKLISYSQPVENLTARHLIDAQDLIAFCARVSNPSNQMNTETVSYTHLTLPTKA